MACALSLFYQSLVFMLFRSCLEAALLASIFFFVISGFLISTILFDNLEKDRFSFREIYGRRIKRIFPALLSVLIFCLILGWFVLFPEEYKQLGKHIAVVQVSLRISCFGRKWDILILRQKPNRYCIYGA